MDDIVPFLGKTPFRFEYQDIHMTYDTKVFQRETNKIERIGKLRPKHYLVVCDGKGHVRFREMDAEKRFKTLGSLRKKGLITEED